MKTGRKKAYEDGEIPRKADEKWSKEANQLHAEWWKRRIARQKEIDASIAAKAEFESLYDKPYEDKKRVRVAGPFTVESLSPHRMLGVDENDDLIDPLRRGKGEGAGLCPDGVGEFEDSRRIRQDALRLPPSHPGRATWSVRKGFSDRIYMSYRMARTRIPIRFFL